MAFPIRFGSGSFNKQKEINKPEETPIIEENIKLEIEEKTNENLEPENNITEEKSDLEIQPTNTVHFSQVLKNIQQKKRMNIQKLEISSNKICQKLQQVALTKFTV